MKKFLCVLLIAVTVLSLAACQGNENPTTTAPNGSQPAGTTVPAGPKQLNLSETYTAITASVQMPDMMRIDEDMLLDLYGIKAGQYKQVEVYLCSNNLQADEIWLIEAVDAEALAALKTLAEARLQQKDDESVTYSPAQNAIVKKAHLATYGNYLVMIVSPDVETITAAFKTEAGV